MKNTCPFRSFWMGGFECSDQLNHFGNRVDLLSETGHIEAARADYRLLADLGIYTVREGIRWSFVEERPYHYNFDMVKTMMEAAAVTGIQQIWDICHFGFPVDLSPLHPHFSDRFVGICAAFATFQKENYPNERLIVTPVNEVGFISWLGGEQASTTPYAKGIGWDIKYALVKAYILGIKAIKTINPEAWIMTTEPLVNIVPPLNASLEMIMDAEEKHEIQYQTTDMLTGKICPELGGAAELVDFIGLNFYYNNQWLANEPSFLPWANLEPDPRWRSLSSLLEEAYLRYETPIILSETSHAGEHRPNWLEMITKECFKTLQMGIPLKGICLYPIIDRPDWDHGHFWHHSGLWDADTNDPHARNLYIPYAQQLAKSMDIIKTLSS